MTATTFIGESNFTGNYSDNPGAKVRSSGTLPITFFVMVIFSTCAFIVVIGNGLVLFGLARFKILRHPSNIFVGILSAVDMTLSVSFVMMATQHLVPWSQRGLLYCQVRLILPTSNLLASELSLLGRCNFWYQSHGWHLQWFISLLMCCSICFTLQNEL